MGEWVYSEPGMGMGRNVRRTRESEQTDKQTEQKLSQCPVLPTLH